MGDHCSAMNGKSTVQKSERRRPPGRSQQDQWIVADTREPGSTVMKEYHFVTIWRTKAPLSEVYREIHASDSRPEWWPAVKKVETLSKGNDQDLGTVRRMTWKGALPYSLAFDMKSTIVEPETVLAGDAFGELEGHGRWEFSREGEDTIIRYDWKVYTTKAWMNLFAPIAKPMFQWNHDHVMKGGAEGLSQRLGAAVIDESP